MRKAILALNENLTHTTIKKLIDQNGTKKELLLLSIMGIQIPPCS